MPKQPRQPDMQQMLRQVQKMQHEMEAAQEQLRHEIVEASAAEHLDAEISQPA